MELSGGMDFANTYPGSAFTEYYGSTNATQYYSYNNYQQSTLTYPTSYQGSRQTGSATSAAGALVSKLGADTLVASQWSAFAPNWDLKSDTLSITGMLKRYLILHLRYVTCSCALMCWYLEQNIIGNQIFSSVHCANFPCICEAFSLYSPRFACT